jgi:hypothetical protein
MEFSYLLEGYHARCLSEYRRTSDLNHGGKRISRRKKQAGIPSKARRSCLARVPRETGYTRSQDIPLRPICLNSVSERSVQTARFSDA